MKQGSALGDPPFQKQFDVLMCFSCVIISGTQLPIKVKEICASTIRAVTSPTDPEILTGLARFNLRRPSL